MKRKEKIIGSLVIAALAIVFLFIGYSKPKSEELSKEEMERLFLDVEEKDEDAKEESNSYEKSENNKKVSNEASLNDDSSEEDEEIEENSSNNELATESKGKIVVEIKGEVKNPNVYVLEEGSRIFEVIDMAGGPTEEADLSKINRALYLSDGQCIVVKNINDNEDEGEEDNAVSLNNESVETSNTLVRESVDKPVGEESNIVNINSASKESLMTLHGIGESKAQGIVDYREENGDFKSIEEITNVSGIGEKTFEKIKDKISVK